jgi:hypothetical protein
VGDRRVVHPPDELDVVQVPVAVDRAGADDELVGVGPGHLAFFPPFLSCLGFRTSFFRTLFPLLMGGLRP